MRKHNLFAVAAVVFGTLVIPVWCGATKWSDLSKVPHSTDGWHLVSPAIPFSFEQVLSYFYDVFGKPAYKVHDRTFVYIEGNAPEESVTIALSATERKIAVTLFAGGDRGVNYLREFFEAPFFRRSEGEQLYALLDANHDTRSAELGRFDVKIEVFKTREWIIISTEFGPPGSYGSEIGSPHPS